MKALLSISLLFAFSAGVWGNKPEQIAQWKEAAARGEAVAQFNLGRAYVTGEGHS